MIKQVHMFNLYNWIFFILLLLFKQNTKPLDYSTWKNFSFSAISSSVSIPGIVALPTKHLTQHFIRLYKPP